MRLATLNDILMAWQGAQIGYRRALDLAQIDTLGELYEAAILSGVEIRTFLTREELAMAEIVARGAQIRRLFLKRARIEATIVRHLEPFAGPA